MKIFKVILLTFISFHLFSCSTNQPQDPTEITSNSSSIAEVTVTEEDPDELICRKELVTGSNFRRRVCKTRAERAESSQQDRTLINEAFQR